MQEQYTAPACRRCGLPVRSTARIFCSNACRAATLQNRVQLVCARCQEHYQRPVSQARGRVSYCSPECQNAARKIPVVCCTLCGKAFPASRHRLAQGQGRFCSMKCYGDSMRGKPRDLPETERFWSHVDKTGDCWLWTGAVCHHGYGHFWPHRSHRFAWRLASGEAIPVGMLIAHTCDVRRCTRNDEAGSYVVNGIAYPRWGHLWLATPAANSADMVTKGRSMTGDRHWSHRKV